MKIKELRRRIKGKNQQLNEAFAEILSIKYFQRRYLLEDKILHSEDSGITSFKYFKDKEVIISLTTYGKRIWDVCTTIESLMQQTYLANRIVLNIDSHFKNSQIPESLHKQIRRGLEIHYVKDIGSYTKLIPTMKLYPNDYIITVDDDQIYDFDLIERLIKTAINNPDKICACRVHEITFDHNNDLKSYEEWKKCVDKCENNCHYFLTGVGGVIYPPSSLGNDVYDEDTFLSICKYADDVWFNAMALKNGTKIVKVQTRSTKGEDYLMNMGVQDIGLYNINTGTNGRNDEQIQAVYSRYDLYKLIK